MFSHDLFTSLFGALRPGELEHLPGLVRTALREGYGVVLNEPGSKKPLCVHTTAAARRKADRETYDADMAAGAATPRRAHDCAIKGHTLTEADAPKVTALVKKLTEHYGGTPNIALNPGRSRLVAADMDTPEQRDAFLQAWTLADPLTVPNPETLYTVRSPGKKVGDTWEHSEGGHVWFTLPEGFTIPEGKHVITDPEGKWSLIFGTNCQVLVPPSVREEGAYQIVGSPLPAPAWVLERIETETVMWAERRRIGDENAAARAASGELDPTDVAHHDDVLPWSVVLLERDWTDANRVDTCGCRIWTAPGPHASYKSATAHELGCSHPHYDDHSGHRPIHLWSDTVLPAAPRTLTKFAFIAWWDHDGDMGAASRALGLAVNQEDAHEVQEVEDFRAELTAQLEDPVPEPSTPDPQPVDNSGHEEVTAQPDQDVFDTVASSDQVEPDDSADEEDEPGPWFGRHELGLIKPPRPMIRGVLDHRAMTLLSGKFGTYKTFLALDWAASIANGVPWAGHEVPEALPVVYVAAEGVSSFDRRLQSWEHDRIGGRLTDNAMLTVHGGPVNITDNKAMSELVAVIREKDAKLVVIDTLSRCAPGLEENEATKVALALERLFTVRDLLDVAVLVLHHTGHNGLRARGSSVLDDNADASWVIKLNGENNEDRGPDNPRTLTHRKSKDGELIADVPMVLKAAAGSAHLTYDPMDRPAPTKKRGTSLEDVEAWCERLSLPLNMPRADLAVRAKEDGFTVGAQLLRAGFDSYHREQCEPPESGCQHVSHRGGVNPS